MKAYLFPGQGAQFVGMGKDLYENSEIAKELFEQANDILGFRITDIMFSGTKDELRQTNVTQPAIFLHSVIMANVLADDFKPDMVAGHSLGEFSSITASGVLSFKDGLKLVEKRATAMQKACKAAPSTMAAIIGIADEKTESICKKIDDIVVPANYNSPGQIVISGSENGIAKAIEELKKAGARRAIKLNVGGAFHSPLMAPAKKELEEAIKNTYFGNSICPVYQNVNAKPVSNSTEIKSNLIEQLTAPVRWSQIINNMIKDGAESFTEIGPGKVLQGLVRKINRKIPTFSVQ